MKKFLSFGFVLVAVLTIAISLHLNSGNKLKLSYKSCDKYSTFNKDIEGEFTPFTFTSPIQATEIVNILEIYEIRLPKYHINASKHRKSQVAKLSALKYHSSRLYYLLHYSKLQGDGYYFFTLCKILI